MPATLAPEDQLIITELRRNWRAEFTAIVEPLRRQVEALLQRSSRPPGTSLGQPAMTDTTSVGRKFVESDELKALLSSPGQRGKAITTVGSLFERKQILTDVGAPAPTVRLPGLVPQPRRALRLRDVINVRPFDTVSAGSVDYLRQKPRTTHAAPQVQQGDVKAEVKIETDLVTSKFSTIAAWTSASRQVLMDLLGLQQFINEELVYQVLLEEEKEILTGTGAANGQLDGLLPAATAYSGGQAGDQMLDTLARAEAQLLGVDVTPNAVVINSGDMAKIGLLKDNQGRYLTDEPGDSDFGDRTLWGLSVVVSNSMPVGQFLVGDFLTGCQLLDRQSATVEIATEHSDYFTRNLIAIRCEERVALLIFAPWAFVTGTFSGSTVSGAPAPSAAHAPKK
jgi:HK97 family phage major capsid protein